MIERFKIRREHCVLAGAILLLVGAAGCRGGEEAEAAAVVRPVSTFVVGQGYEGRLTFPGTVQAANRAELSFRVPGPLIEFPVNEGDQVARGELLARIDPRDFLIAVSEEKAGFDQAEADARRYQRLYEREAVPLADVQLYQARRDVARARYEQAQANLDYTQLRAPFAGQIGIKHVENFEDVQARESVLSIHDFSVVEVVIHIPESIIATVRGVRTPSIGVVFDALPDQLYPATIKEFAVNADPSTQTFPVTITMPQPEEINALPGMTATVAMEMELDTDMEDVPLTVPANAVFADEAGTSHVWLIDPSSSTVSRHPVRVGPVIGTESIVILSGLQTGDLIATAGIFQLEEGQEIRPLGS